MDSLREEMARGEGRVLFINERGYRSVQGVSVGAGKLAATDRTSFGHCCSRISTADCPITPLSFSHVFVLAQFTLSGEEMRCRVSWGVYLLSIERQAPAEIGDIALVLMILGEGMEFDDVLVYEFSVEVAWE